MSSDTNELELLKLKMKILEKELELERLKAQNVSNTPIQNIEDLAEYNEPSPIVHRSAPTQGYATKEQLEQLSPAELFILAKKKGISIERIFPL